MVEQEAIWREGDTGKGGDEETKRVRDGEGESIGERGGKGEREGQE